ncbi:MAG: RIP metalloprotease RseP, partial [Bdellovibrionota bacterium]
MTQLSSIFVAIYSNILPFTILLGILVFVHEFGHFIVARMCGVRVEVFSLGFGKKIFSFKRGDTTYCISLIPLGGYVKMFGEMGSEAILTEEDKKVSFSHKSPWKRIAVVLAGPLMNFVFAIFIFTIIAELGEQSRAAVIADVTVNSPAAQLGLKPGDRILEVNSVKIKNYEDFQKILNQFKDSSVSAVLVDVGGQKKDLNLKVTSIDNPNIFSLESKLGQIEGVLPYAKSGVVAVITGSLAYQSGLRTGDEIIEINSQKITQWAQLEALMLNTKSDLS